MREIIKNAKRLVIKLGSALIIDDDGINRAQLAGLGADIHAARQAGKEVLVVSSGAVALGARALNLKRQSIALEQSQAAAAFGQTALMQGWQEALAKYDIPAAQILLTPDDTEQRRRYLNARATIANLLALGIVPVINENDSVATQELRYGDNDRLAARVASMVGADCLILLSDVDGLYDKSPKQHKDAKHIARVEDITPEVLAMAGESDGTYGSGGMRTKIAAAQIATQAGCHMILTSGKIMHPLGALNGGENEGARATLFAAQKSPRAARKNWIAGSLEPKGALTIDQGAEQALQAGKSLLPVGITQISGAFERGDCVRVLNLAQDEIARGLIAYGAEDASRIIGRSSGDIAAILGYQSRAAMIHRDDLVMK